MSSTKPRAIVVEDDPGVRKLLRKYLEELNFLVDEAGNGKACLKLLAGEKPRLVCVDLILPDMSGYDVCERIRADGRLTDVAIVVCSARSLPADLALAEDLGADAYLVKPIRWSSFSSTVAALVSPDRPGTR